MENSRLWVVAMSVVGAGLLGACGGPSVAPVVYYEDGSMVDEVSHMCEGEFLTEDCMYYDNGYDPNYGTTDTGYDTTGGSYYDDTYMGYDGLYEMCGPSPTPDCEVMYYNIITNTSDTNNTYDTYDTSDRECPPCTGDGPCGCEI